MGPGDLVVSVSAYKAQGRGFNNKVTYSQSPEKASGPGKIKCHGTILRAETAGLLIAPQNKWATRESFASLQFGWP